MPKIVISKSAVRIEMRGRKLGIVAVRRDLLWGGFVGATNCLE